MFMKNDTSNMTKINMTTNSNRHMLNNAGKNMARANSRILMTFALLISRKTRPILATLTICRSTGGTNYLEIKSFNTRPMETGLGAGQCAKVLRFDIIIRTHKV